MNMEKTLPDFRLIALEEKFAIDFTKICEISSSYGKLRLYYDIRRMMKLMKLEHKVKDKHGKWEELYWEKIKPFHFYLNPLKVKYTYMRDELRHLNELGPLYYRYPFDRNYQLERRLINTIEADLVA